MAVPPLNHGKAVQKVILILLHCIGIFLSNRNHRLVDTDKFPSPQIVYIFKIDNVRAVNPLKGGRQKMMLEYK